MYIESINNLTLNTSVGDYKIIELKVRGKKAKLEKFNSDIQDFFDMADEEWTDSLSMLTMTFDNKPKEQTMNMIKSFTKNYIEQLTINS